jgi:hypothetical protein
VDLVGVGVAGEHDDQAAVDLAGYPAAPAAGLADGPGCGARPG